jgi:hypothetical protein
MLGPPPGQVNVQSERETSARSALGLRPSLRDAIWCILAHMGKTRMNIYLNDAQKKLLEKLSTETGAPVAELVRRAIDAYLLSRKKELK